MNEKGFIATISVLMALFISALFFVAWHPLILGRVTMNKITEEFVAEKIQSRNGLERLYSVFYSDISSDVTSLDYQTDLGILYVLADKTAPITTVINKQVATGENIYVNNRTTLTFTMSGTNFDYQIYFNNVLVDSGNSPSGYSWEKVIAGPADYGRYKVVYSPSTIVTVEYEEQTSRSISIQASGKDELLLIIDNDTSTETTTMKLKLVRE